MTKIFYLSDIHFDYSYFDVKKHLLKSRRKKHWLVVAGDFLTHTNLGAEKIVNFLNDLSPYYKYVLCVLGNHDLTGYKLDDASFITGLSSNVYMLDMNNPIVLDGYAVFGDIMWCHCPVLSERTFLKLDEYILVKDREGNKLTMDYTNEYFSLYKNLLAQFLYDYKEYPKITISHFPPLRVPNEYPINALSYFFETDICNKLFFNNVIYSFFGHTHIKYKEKINDVTFCCNPVGYYKKGFKLESVFLNEIVENEEEEEDNE